jgi:hypothetical protein
MAQALQVDGRAAIFDAGRSAPSPSLGDVLPTELDLPNGAATALTVVSVTGTVSCCNGTPTGGPEGIPGYTTNVASFNGISGIMAPNAMFLVGVFTNGGVPTTPAPAVLDFTAKGLGTSFTSVAPLLDQTFFIGDGRTASGAVQQFQIPSGARKVFFGFVDSDAVASGGPPSAYVDNKGALTLTLGLTSPSPAVPALGTPAFELLAMAFVAIGLLVVKRAGTPRSRRAADTR